MKIALPLLALILTLAGRAWTAAPAPSADSPVGYGGAKIQMMPIMAPVRTPSGTQYQVLTLRLVLAPGDSERPACFMVPIIHEKILLYLHGAKLTPADFSGQRLEVLASKLLEIAVRTTDRSYFTGVEFLDDNSMPPATGNVKTASSLDQRSQTLSSQCK